MNPSNLSWPRAFDQKVDLFYEQALGWQLHIADLVANGDVSGAAPKQAVDIWTAILRVNDRLVTLFSGTLFGKSSIVPPEMWQAMEAEWNRMHLP